jgi:hypothetical protein
MATSALALPLDVPWKRLAISHDMYAAALNADFPETWRSSLAVLFYEPDPDPADTSGEITTFLKVTASITGYNYPNPVLVPPHKRPLGISYQFYPAFCAVVQVAVFPSDETRDINQYPYFTDFQPKQREVIETTNDTGEIVSMSAGPVNVTKSTTTTQGQSVTPALVTNPNQTSATLSQGTATETTVTDASREKRETTSYQTNLSQLYQLLDSYHSGTNRAIFLTMARPHLVDSLYTFVNGPRRLEGIQEFFLVVRRPQTMQGICAKAMLDTAHLDPNDTSGDPATLFVTSRAVSGCTRGGGVQILPDGQWVTYEQLLPSSVNDLRNAAGHTGVEAVAAANALGRSMRDIVVASYRSAVRYPLGKVDFLHTNFAMRKLLSLLTASTLKQSHILELIDKIEPTLNQPATGLTKVDLATRAQLIKALDIAPAHTS